MLAAASNFKQKIILMKNILRDVIAEKCQLPQVEDTFKAAEDLGLVLPSAVHEIFLNWRADECTRTSQFSRLSDLFAKSDAGGYLSTQQYPAVSDFIRCFMNTCGIT
jgi:hypothetical protein